MILTNCNGQDSALHHAPGQCAKKQCICSHTSRWYTVYRYGTCCTCALHNHSTKRMGIRNYWPNPSRSWSLVNLCCGYILWRGSQCSHRSWASCQIRKIAGAHAPGMPGTFPPSSQVSDPDMHHGTCVTHVPWCMPGSLTSGFLWNWRRGETFPAFPAHAQPAIFRIW